MLNKDKYEEVGGGLDVDSTYQKKGEVLKIGDSVEGRYIGKQENAGPKKNSNFYILEKQSGEKVGVWGGAVLDSRFKTIAIGKVVGIEYLGVKKAKNGSDYNDFYVGVGRDFVGDEGETYKRKAGEQPVINLDKEPQQ